MVTRPSNPSVRLAATGDIPAITSMLVRAFDDDPVSNYMFAGRRRRLLGLHSFFTSELRHNYLPHRQVYVTEDLSGAALWGPPDRARHPVLSWHTVRALQLLFTVEGLHPAEPHWYLFTLGTEPERQGHGVGSALLRAMLTQIDEAGEPAYLESSKERNVPLYARFGFQVIHQIPARSGSPPIWRMWREPRVPER
jgi:GNAT superfamily N-acetyltransferase